MRNGRLAVLFNSQRLITRLFTIQSDQETNIGEKPMEKEEKKVRALELRTYLTKTKEEKRKQIKYLVKVSP